MYFETNHVYHIYNQGNNRQKIFFSRNNYLFFIEKIRTHIIPFADILAWCLMPNHFHLMVHVNKIERTEDSGSATSSRAPTLVKESFNKSIGIMLASYTRAINKQEKLTGSLFRDKTKAECLTNNSTITLTFLNTNQGALIKIPNPEKEYPQVCFNYIHNNPVKAKLVSNLADWEFSSYNEFSGNEILINKNRVIEFGLVV